MNTFSFIKKSRPTLKVGDYFYYRIDNKNFIGVVIHTQLQEDIKDNVAIVCLFLNYTFEKEENVSTEQIEKAILEKDILIPPIIINKRGWTKFGYFVNIGNINMDFANAVFQDIRFVSFGGDIYDFQNKEARNVRAAKLIGSLGVYASEGVEPLLQMSLDLDFEGENPDWYNPYGYYDELKSTFPKMELPFWYYKAKERLGKK